MTKYRFKNFETLLACRKAQQSRVISVWRSVFRHLGGAIFDRPDEYDRHKRPVEKIMWLVIRIIAVSGTLFMMLDFTLMYKRSPTFTTPETFLYPIWNVDFPAIAICNVNRISRKAAVDLAQELMEFESTKNPFANNLTMPDLTHMLSLLGQLYLRQDGNADTEPTKRLHTILERAYNDYDVDRIMKRLTPKCKSMLRKCSWKGKDVMCDDIFVLRKTQDGYCCTFNYARRNDCFGSAKDVFASQYVERIMNIGSEYGLSVLLNPQLDDYFYKILPINGFKISVYNPMNHPDATSGQVREVLISPKTETFIELDAIMFHTTEDVQKYDIRERNCLFKTEQSKIFRGYYSFSDCIVYCRLQDIFRLCGCVPFFYPRDVAFDRNCNLKDLSCLTKYRERWKNVKPRFENVMTPFDESKFEGLSGYLSCDCLPSCTDVMYNLQSSSLPLSRSNLSFGRYSYSIQNDSLVRIYFRKTEVMRLRQDVLFHWYEVMSNYGGVCNLFLGVSIINVIEVLYRLIIRICRPDSTNQSTAQIKESIEGNQDSAEVTTITVESVKISQVIQSLHWEELAGVLRKGRLSSSHLSLNPLMKQSNLRVGDQI
ncbi:sodium channel protein Nach-like [Linepithema humile]|uniref:sodium channel protein Nach-like n=1 Tax=Linepithema humile TaxID=83485 RepID=UPI00351F578B